MRRKPFKSATAFTQRGANYDAVLGGMVELLESARRMSVRTVNAIMTATYWEIGRRIVELEQYDARRAEYGSEFLKTLGADLTARFGRGFGWRNLYQIRLFHQSYSDILQTPSANSNPQAVQSTSQTVSAKSDPTTLEAIRARFPLPWSHYVRLLSIDNELARSFYEAEALRGGWSVRQLDRQINTKFYERTALSKNKASVLAKGQRRKPESATNGSGSTCSSSTDGSAASS